MDILYYEGVVWSLMKIKNIKRSQAVKLFNENIFNSTNEEKMKSRCNEILIKIQNSDKSNTLHNSIQLKELRNSNASELAVNDEMEDCEYDITDTKINQEGVLSEVGNLIDYLINKIETEQCNL